MTTATAPAPAPPAPAKSAGRVKRVNTPTVIQMEAVECGAAALAIILGYHGRIVPLEELRAACGVSRDGSKANNILKGARGFGLTAKGYRKEPADLRSVPMPAIVHWDLNHFLVVEGFDKDKVYLSDPSVGRRVVSADEFDRSFTGVILTFEPGPEFKKGGRKPSLFGALGARLRGSERGLLYVVIASLALIIPNLAIPLFTQVFVDQYLIQGMNSILGPLLIGMTITAVLRGLLTWFQQHALLKLETKIALTSSSRFFWHVLRLPMEFYAQRQAGEINSRVGLNDRVAQLLSGDLATTALNITLITFYAIVMFRYDVLLTLIGILIAGLNFLLLRVVSRRRKDGNQRLLQERSKLQGTSVEGLQIVESLKATGSENEFFGRWSGFQAAVNNAENGMGVSSQILTVVPTMLTSLSTVAILGIGGIRVMDGAMTAGMLVAFQSLMSSFLQPVNGLVNLGAQLQEVEGDMNRLDDVLRYPRDPLLAEDAVDDAAPVAVEGTAPLSPRLTGRIEFKNITFGYSRLEPPLIQDFNLSVRPGARIALVGGTGSGKSTLARLVGGLFQPWSGAIYFDGIARNDLPRRSLTSSVAMVDQDIFLFEGTVGENLSMWDRTIPEAAIVRAAQDAAIHEAIAARPGGYDSRVEEGGRNFSGGQRQRLEIARALATDPTILVLDEATSALDPITEKEIDDNLRRRGCTCLIIAHRLSTIRDADEIIVLERGKVVERGPHTELMRKNGAYARLIRAEAVSGESGGKSSSSILERLAL